MTSKSQEIANMPGPLPQKEPPDDRNMIFAAYACVLMRAGHPDNTISAKI